MSFARHFNPRLRGAILAQAEPLWLRQHPRRSYIVACVVQTPVWPELQSELRWTHWCVKAWSRVTGRDYVADHIVPLNHPLVSGLNVPANLRIVPRAVNAAKGNKFSMEEQLELPFCRGEDV